MNIGQGNLSGESKNRGGKASTTLRFFTICARNFLPNARVLYDSVREHHPDAVFTVYLCDRDRGYDPDEVGMTLVAMDQLGIPDIEGMIRRYNVTELCTAIKPYCFIREYDLARPEDSGDPLSSDQVIYCDPDLEFFSPLREVTEALASGAQMVLTPHILYPAEHAEFTDRQYLQLGIYNLGFLATRPTAAVRDAMLWWARRMIAECVIDLPRGLFVDQKWADLFPSFLDDVKVLRHPGYNIAYWNLHERRIHGAVGELRVNNVPLRFVHYSGIIAGDEPRLSRHSEMYTLTNSFGYGRLVERYRDRLNNGSLAHLRKLPFCFIADGPTGRNLHALNSGDDKKGPVWRRPKHFMFARQFFDLESYVGYKRREQREIEDRREYERSLLPDLRDEAFSTKGYCYTCDKRRKFVTGFMYSTEADSEGRPIPNWREHVACPQCRLPNRVRASMHLFLQEFEPSPDAKIYITEQKTRLFDWLSERFQNLTGSEYFGDGVAKGAIVDGVRNENMEDLSFEDAQFDFLLSFDVMEHVADTARSIKEAYRVLAPGGWMFFTAPAHLDRYATTIRAEIGDDGAIVHHTEPEYHGNPVDPEGGALCFRYFGWDILDQLSEVGFRRPFAYHYWSRECGYLGPDHVIFVAEKPK